MKDVGILSPYEDAYSITPGAFRKLLFSINQWPLSYCGMTFQDVIKEEKAQLQMDKKAFYYRPS